MPSSTAFYANAVVISVGIWSSLAIAQAPAAGSGDPAAFTLQKYVRGDRSQSPIPRAGLHTVAMTT